MSFYLMHRGWMENDAFRGHAFCERGAWAWLIENAAWQDTRVKIDRKPVELKRGELSFSERFLAAKWRWSKARVHRFLEDLTTWGMIERRNSPVQKTEHQADHPQSIIKLCNYDKYQASELTVEPSIEPSTNHPRTISEPKKKEVKEVKKEDSFADATESSARARRASRPSLTARLEEWKPVEKHYRLAEHRGRNYEWVTLEAECYRNWNRNAKHAHKDFNAGFSNWITSEYRDGNGEARSGRNHARSDSVASAYRELRLEAIDGRLRH